MTNFCFFNKKHINMDYELNIPVQMGSTYKISRIIEKEIEKIYENLCQKLGCYTLFPIG